MQANRKRPPILCLVIVLVGPWLVQAQAAETFARSVAELLTPGAIEPLDDLDDGATSVGSARFADASAPVLAAGPQFLAPAPAPLPLPARLRSVSVLDGPTPFWPPGPASRRQARLQVFRF